MSDPTIAFLAQPVQALARRGEKFAQQVIHTLHGWVKSDHTRHVVSHVHHRLFVLSEGAADWKLVVIVREGQRHSDYAVDVCAVDFAQPQRLVDHWKPLAEVDHLAPAMRVRLHKIEPLMFTMVADSMAAMTPISWLDADAFRRHRELKPGNLHHLSGLLHAFDSSGHRWVSSKARNNFKTLLEDARTRPQIVEREGDDLFVVSRRYLEQTVEPTSAQALSRHYRARPLSDAGMPELARRPLPPLEDLPELGSA